MTDEFEEAVGERPINTLSVDSKIGRLISVALAMVALINVRLQRRCRNMRQMIKATTMIIRVITPGSSVRRSGIIDYVAK